MMHLFDELRRAEGRLGQEMSVVFLPDVEMRRLNRQHRGIDKATDVLSFPPGEAVFPGEGPWLGELAVSLPTCARQAKRLGHGAGRELAFLLLHGFMHLCGYDHEQDEAAWSGNELRLGRLCQSMLPPGWDRRAMGLSHKG